jgi:hypothetical protein
MMADDEDDSPQWHTPSTATPAAIGSGIEALVLEMLTSLAAGTFPTQPRQHIHSTVAEYNPESGFFQTTGALNDDGQAKGRMDMYVGQHRIEYAAKDLQVLAAAHKNLTHDPHRRLTCTLRELYYR